jgi:hypothetical protein
LGASTVRPAERRFSRVSVEVEVVVGMVLCLGEMV